MRYNALLFLVPPCSFIAFCYSAGSSLNDCVWVTKLLKPVQHCDLVYAEPDPLAGDIVLQLKEAKVSLRFDPYAQVSLNIVAGKSACLNRELVSGVRFISSDILNHILHSSSHIYSPLL